VTRHVTMELRVGGHDGGFGPRLPRGVSLGRMARLTDDPTTQRLREIAAQEAASTKERLAVRTGAARSFSATVARLAEAKAVWHGIQAEAERAKAKAVGDLLGTGLEAGEVAELLGISERELRTLRATAPERPANVNGAARQAAAMRTAS
jgi:hypothetical protein